MNQLRFAGLALLLSAATAMAAVDPVLLNLVMPDATVLSGIQVDQTIASPFGQYLLTQIQVTDVNLQNLMASTGFDPRKDLHEILAATSSTGTGSHTGLVLGRGTFQPSQIIAAAAAGGGTLTQYKGVTVISSATNKGGAGAFAFLNSSTAVMGDLASVQAAIDRQGSTYSGALAAKAQAASATNQAWFATVTPLSEFLSGKVANPGLNNISQNNLFQSVQQASGGVAFASSGVTISADAVTSSNQNAQALVDVLKFMASLIQTNQANNNVPNNVASLADAATFIANGATAHMSLALSEQQAEQLFTPLTAKKAARARH